MILVDSNVPMYLVGAPHPYNVDAQRTLERLIAEHRRLVTDAAAFQEILHRYAAIDRRDAIQPAFDALLGVADEVLPIELDDVSMAKDLLATHPNLSARDALHVAVMRHHRIACVLSFDRAFDTVPGIERLPVG